MRLFSKCKWEKQSVIVTASIDYIQQQMGNEPEIQFTTTGIISYQSTYDSSLGFHLFQLVSTFNNYQFGHLKDTYQADLLF